MLQADKIIQQDGRIPDKQKKPVAFLYISDKRGKGNQENNPVYLIL